MEKKIECVHDTDKPTKFLRQFIKLGQRYKTKKWDYSISLTFKYEKMIIELRSILHLLYYLMVGQNAYS
jgi:hypothetical protein